MKMFDADKTGMIGLPYGEKNYDNTLSPFHLIPERYGQTDGRGDRIAISISRDENRTARNTTFLYNLIKLFFNLKKITENLCSVS